MTQYLPDWRDRAVSPADALALVRSGMRVFVQGACATPTPLLEALAVRTDLEDIRLYHLHLAGGAPWLEGDRAERFHSISLFTGPGLRQPVEDGRADFVPIFLSDVPGLFSSGRVALDVAFVQLSPPDAHGSCSLGTSVDAARAAVDSARFIVAEINDRMPRTHGNTSVPFDRIDAFITTDRPLHEHAGGKENAVEARIGEIIADLVEDRSTLQMGIGAIPDAVLTRLHDKHDLGVHTEMFSDRLVDLCENGVVTNKFK
ncbi:MAG: 4-hydroxybutyrate CoA-transferase, partial [Gemmatimonadota bacterium]|nr:4-hydroxybutyrate CoA-transferase [Gemmatimonadota bacterium]